MADEVQPVKRNSPGIFLAAVLILIGVFFLGINYGWWSPQVLWRTVSLWPLLLIAGGIKLILPRGRLGDLIAIAFLVVSAAVILAYPPAANRLTSTADVRQNQSEARDLPGNVEKANVTINSGAASIDLGALGAEADKLFDVNATNMGPLDITSTTSGNESQVEISEHMRGWHFGSGDRHIQVNLSRKPQLKLNLNAGAARSNFSMRDLKVSELDFNGGASNMTFDFGSLVDQVKASIDGGASKVVIKIPRDYGIDINFDGGLNSNNFASAGINKQGDNHYQTDGFDQSSKQFGLDFDGGASNIQIERY